MTNSYPAGSRYQDPAINVFKLQGPRKGSSSAVPADGLATPSAAVGPGSGEICPFCGQRTTRYEHSSSAGTRAASLCCGIPQEFLDNYDVYEGLPEPLRRAAINRKKAEYVAMDEEDAEIARRYRESRDKWEAKHSHMMKGD